MTVADVWNSYHPSQPKSQGAPVSLVRLPQKLEAESYSSPLSSEEDLISTEQPVSLPEELAPHPGLSDGGYHFPQKR